MRPLSLAALLLAACATSGDQRYVILESDSYGCGAAEGLGCGLAIAPVLEQIDTLEGVEESSVSWDGRYFRIELVPGSDPDRVAAEATSLLEGEACCVTASRGKAKPAEADQWFNSEQTLALSRHEASVIAADLMAEVQAEVELEPDAAEKLGTVFREELERAFEQAHAEGGGVYRLREQLPEGWTRLEARIAELLSQDQARAVLAVLEREIQE
jgi:hypothetical protein